MVLAHYSSVNKFNPCTSINTIKGKMITLYINFNTSADIKLVKIKLEGLELPNLITNLTHLHDIMNPSLSVLYLPSSKEKNSPLKYPYFHVPKVLFKRNIFKMTLLTLGKPNASYKIV